jgi:hypothetical protein
VKPTDRDENELNKNVTQKALLFMIICDAITDILVNQKAAHYRITTYYVKLHHVIKQRCIESIVTGTNAEIKVTLTRIHLPLSKLHQSFVWKEKTQINNSIATSFAKSQGQTIEHVGIYL